MSKVDRINLDRLVDNEALLDNDNSFNLEDFINQNTPDKFNGEESIKGIIPDGIGNLDLRLPDEVVDTNRDVQDALKTNRFITDIQIQMLFNMLKITYAEYMKSGKVDDLRKVNEIIYAINSTKNHLLGAHKDLADIEYKKSRTDATVINNNANINMDGGEFRGTPNDILKHYGGSVDTIEFVDGVAITKNEVDLNNDEFEREGDSQEG